MSNGSERIAGIFGYVQKSNRYHWKVDGEIQRTQGFKSRKDCDKWLKETTHQVDWRVDFLVKFKGLGTAWELVDKYGKKVYYQ